MVSITQFVFVCSLVAVALSCSNTGGRRAAKVCDELLSEEVCDSLRKTTKILKLKGEDAEEFIRDASRKGIRGGRDVKDFIRDRLDRELKRKPCEDILDKKRCRKIKEYAKDIGASAKKVRESIKNAISDGVSGVGKVYDSTMRKMKKSFNRDRFAERHLYHRRKHDQEVQSQKAKPGSTA